MDIVVDIECFHNNIVKELAFCTTSGFNAGFMFRPPYSYESCDDVEKQQNSWLTRNLHQIAWNAGDYEFSEQGTIVKFIARQPGAEFYAKGLEKCNILVGLFGKEFTNLEDFGCPTSHGGDTVCDSYPARHNNIQNCAQRKSKSYAKWLLEFNDLFTVV